MSLHSKIENRLNEALKAKDKKQKAQDRQAVKDARKTKDKEQRKKDVKAAKQKRKANRAARKGKYKIKK